MVPGSFVSAFFLLFMIMQCVSRSELTECHGTEAEGRIWRSGETSIIINRRYCIVINRISESE